MYDSQNWNAPDSLQQQNAALLQTEENAITLNFLKVPKQTNCSDRGVYAVAYATALCLGRSPSMIQFDENMMRPHLIKCLQDGQFTMFPVRQTRRITIQAAQCVRAHCICCMPSVDGIDMIECTGCQEWFHVACVAPSSSVLNCTNLPWYCEDCS